MGSTTPSNRRVTCLGLVWRSERRRQDQEEKDKAVVLGDAGCDTVTVPWLPVSPLTPSM